MKPLNQDPQLQIKNISIVDVVQRSGVALEKVGSLYQGLCPFHADKDTPSLRVYPQNNSWCCFGGCVGRNGRRNGGDVIEWVRQKEGLSFRQAVAFLTSAGTFNIKSVSPVTQVEVQPRPVDFDLVNYWHQLLDRCARREWFRLRGFTDAFIDRELWGWDGQRYVIPVWEGEPGFSTCLGVRLRLAPDLGAEGPKYKGLGGHNPATVWGRWYCRNDNVLLAFAGELDAARAVQDGFPAFSMVNGSKAFHHFPSAWPAQWFPNAEFLIVVFDRKEERDAGELAMQWNKVKGSLTARLFQWLPGMPGKDYCEYRDAGNSADDFRRALVSQLQGIYS